MRHRSHSLNADSTETVMQDLTPPHHTHARTNKKHDRILRYGNLQPAVVKFIRIPCSFLKSHLKFGLYKSFKKRDKHRRKKENPPCVDIVTGEQIWRVTITAGLYLAASVSERSGQGINARRPGSNNAKEEYET